MKLLTIYASFKRILINTGKGKLFLLLFAPFFVTPQDFIAIDRSKGVFVRVAGWFIPSSAALFCGTLGSFGFSAIIKSRIPDISGVTGAEYASYMTFLNKIIWLELTVLSFLGIYFYAFLAPVRFKVLRFLFKGMRDEFQTPTIKYFLLMGSSKVVWGSIFVAFCSLFFVFEWSYQGKAAVHRFVSDYGGLTTALLLVCGLMSLRREEIRTETDRQMFTTARARMLSLVWDFGTLLLPIPLFYAFAYIAKLV